MLKGIDPILSPELLMHLSAMGHGEWVAVVDANFTANYLSQGKPVVRLPGISLERASQAVLSVFPLDSAVVQPAAYMKVCDMPDSHRT
ncbi:MAG: L-fucose mutarotase, partial [Pseudomonadota bacterium]